MPWAAGAVVEDGGDAGPDALAAVGNAASSRGAALQDRTAGIGASGETGIETGIRAHADLFGVRSAAAGGIAHARAAPAYEPLHTGGSLLSRPARDMRSLGRLVDR